MKQLRLLQLMIIAGWSVKLIAYFLPIGYWYGDQTSQKLLHLDGYGALFVFEAAFIYTLPYFVQAIGSLGIFFYQNWGRYMLLLVWAYGLISSIFFGIRIIEPAQGLLSNLSGSIDDAILVLVFLTPLRDHFVKNNL